MSNHKKKRNSQINMKSLVITLSLLCVVGLVIGYAVLTEQLTINNIVSYDAMKWDVGFTEAEDFSDDFEEYLSKTPSLAENAPEFIPATVSISEDEKSVTYNCNLGSSTKYKNCSILVTVTNNSTFDVKLKDFNIQSPTQETQDFINNYVDRMMPIWYTSMDSLDSPTIISEGDIIRAGHSKQILIYVDYSELTEDTLPADGISTSGSFYIDWEETESK